MEIHANTIEDYLIDGLNFKLNPGASYVTERKSVSFQAQGSNVYKPSQGVRVIRFNINSNGLLDPSTVKIFFELKNNGAANRELRLLGPGHVLFRRLRIMSGNGSAIIEDVDDFNRISHLFWLMSTDEYKKNTDIESGFLSRWDRVKELNLQYPEYGSHINRGIPGGSKKFMSFTPLAGIFMQPKYLPLQYMGGLVIELELVNDQLDPIISQGPNNEDPANAALNFVVQNDNAALINTSVDWELLNLEVKCDLVTLDSALENSMAQHLLNGGTFPINYSTFISQQQVLTNMISSVNINRSASRLKTVFISCF
jgi:hypothetical protein